MFFFKGFPFWAISNPWSYTIKSSLLCIPIPQNKIWFSFKNNIFLLRPNHQEYPNYKKSVDKLQSVSTKTPEKYSINEKM